MVLHLNRRLYLLVFSIDRSFEDNRDVEVARQHIIWPQCKFQWFPCFSTWRTGWRWWRYLHSSTYRMGRWNLQSFVLSCMSKNPFILETSTSEGKFGEKYFENTFQHVSISFVWLKRLTFFQTGTSHIRESCFNLSIYFFHVEEALNKKYF